MSVPDLTDNIVEIPGKVVHTNSLMIIAYVARNNIVRMASRFELTGGSSKGRLRGPLFLSLCDMTIKS
jgi:thioredoxin-related protein